MQAVYLVLDFQSNSVGLFVTLWPASKHEGSLTIGGVILPEQTWAAAFEGRACSCCVPGLPASLLPSTDAFSTFIHKTLDPPFTTPQLPDIITHTPTTRTLDYSKWLAAKVRSLPPRRRAACARESTCRILTRFSTGKTGGKTGGKAGGDSTGKTQKSHSAKAGLQVRDIQQWDGSG
jgi:hypothetical protein